MYFPKFDLTITKSKEIIVNGEQVFTCDFPEYYQYFIEIFDGLDRYLIISPSLWKIYKRGVASPYSVDRSLVVIIHLKSQKRSYTSFDDIKQIQQPKAIEFAKDKDWVYMIKEISLDKEELILLNGGKEIKEVRLKLYTFYFPLFMVDPAPSYFYRCPTIDLHLLLCF